MQGLKSVVNEKFGDGIMSAIDFYVTVDKVSATNDATCYVLSDLVSEHVLAADVEVPVALMCNAVAL